MRHMLMDDSLTSAEQNQVLHLAAQMREDRSLRRPFEGPKTVALLFDLPSTRTRVSFATGVAELGGHSLVIDTGASQLGRGEPIADTARILSRMNHMIVWRTSGHERLVEMAEHASVPVINALTDAGHPCQILADFATIAQRRDGLEESGPALAGRTLAYCGDGANNMAASYLIGGALAGMHVRVAAPAGWAPSAETVQRASAIAAETGGSVTVTEDPREACLGAQVIATDTWVSMGTEKDERIERALRPYEVTEELMALGDDALFLHCLPAYRGMEVAASIIDGPASAVWDEAENRLHAQKALMTFLADAASSSTGQATTGEAATGEATTGPADTRAPGDSAHPSAPTATMEAAR